MEGDSIVADDMDCDFQLSKVPCQVMSKAIVVIDQQNQGPTSVTRLEAKSMAFNMQCAFVHVSSYS